MSRMSCTPLQNVSINLLPFLFSRRYEEPTIGAAFLTQTVQDAENKVTVKFEIWDTAGQERYRSLAPMYYRGAAAAIVVFDITKRDSFNGARCVTAVGLCRPAVRHALSCHVMSCHEACAISIHLLSPPTPLISPLLSRSWVKELQKRGDMNVVIALAGNKCDQESKRRVEQEEAAAYAKENEIIFMETVGARHRERERWRCAVSAPISGCGGLTCMHSIGI